MARFKIGDRVYYHPVIGQEPTGQVHTVTAGPRVLSCGEVYWISDQIGYCPAARLSPAIDERDKIIDILQRQNQKLVNWVRAEAEYQHDRYSGRAQAAAMRRLLSEVEAIGDE